MDILNGKVVPMYLRLLGASVGSAVTMSVFSTIDAMMVGQYHGPEGTAALAVFMPVWSLVYSLGILASVGGSILFAHTRGQGAREKSDQYFTLTLICGVVLSAVAMVVLGLFHEPLFRFFGANGDDRLVSMAREYLKSVWFAVPCCVFSSIQSAFLRNDGNAGLSMKAVLFGGACNLVGDYLLVFVFDLGIFGAGLATAIGLYATNLLMLLHYRNGKNTLRPVRVSTPFRQVGQILKTGFPAAVADLAMGIIIILLNNQVMNRLGVDALAVYGVIAQIVPFVQCCAYGVGQAAQPIMSQNLGAKNYRRVGECLRCGLYTSAAFGVFWFVLVELAPNALVWLFMTPTDTVLSIAPGIFRAYGTSFLLLTFNVFASDFFQILMKPKIAAAASFGRGLVISGVAILILPVFFGNDAIWWSMTVAEIVVALYSAWQMSKCYARCQECR